MRFIHIAMAAALLASGASAGNLISVMGTRPDANGGYTSQKTTVDIGALDLNKSEDAPAILERLKEGVERACTPRALITGDLARRIKTCQKQGLAETITNLDAPALTKLSRGE